MKVSWDIIFVNSLLVNPSLLETGICRLWPFRFAVSLYLIATSARTLDVMPLSHFFFDLACDTRIIEFRWHRARFPLIPIIQPLGLQLIPLT